MVRRNGAVPISYLAVAGIIWGLLLFFSKYESDSSSFVPAFSLIFVNMFLITYIASYSRLGLGLVSLYGLAGFYKVAFYYRSILNCIPDHTFSCEVHLRWSTG